MPSRCIARHQVREEEETDPGVAGEAGVTRVPVLEAPNGRLDDRGTRLCRRRCLSEATQADSLMPSFFVREKVQAAGRALNIGVAKCNLQQLL